MGDQKGQGGETPLGEIETAFRQLAESIDQIFWVLGLEPFELVYVSASVEHMWGLATDSSLGTFPHAVVPEDLEAFGEIFAGAMHEATEREYRIEQPDGTCRWLRTRAFPVRNATGSTCRIAGITEDITESKRIADELSFRAELDRLTTDLATNFINLPTEEIDRCIGTALGRLGSFLHADVAYVFLVGEDADTVGGVYSWMRASGLVLRDAAVDWRLSTFPWFAQHVLSRKHVCVGNVHALPAEAARDRAVCETLGIESVYAVPMIAAQAVIGWLGFVVGHETQWTADALRLLDVAAEMLAGALERKRAALELAHHREFERLITHLSANFINIPSNALDAGMRDALRELAKVTGDDWAVVYVMEQGSMTALPTYEWRSERFERRKISLHSVELGPHDPLGRALRENGVLHVPSLDELPAEAPPGEREYLETLGIAALVDIPLISGGTLLGLLGFASRTEKRWPAETIALLRIAAEMFANAIERIRTENRMRLHEAELAHALRMGTMGELAAGLAHELNQPLAAILGFARGCENRLLSGRIDDAELVTIVRKIADQALRAGNVIRTMRAHVRKTEPRRQWCDVNDLLADVLGLGAEDIARNGIRLVRQLETKLPQVQVNPTQIQQVLLNLVRNAVDAVAVGSRNGRTIVVSTGLAGQNAVEISVSDTGAGLQAEALERVFEPFYTTKSGGLGLGLSIARSIAEAHGGRLWATPNPGAGATFRLRLYRSDGKEGGAA